MPSPLQHHPKGAPGSDQAIKNGCLCPVMDNARGRGMYIDTDGLAIYAVSNTCPVHNYPIPIEQGGTDVNSQP
jgi:hypothetical protein